MARNFWYLPYSEASPSLLYDICGPEGNTASNHWNYGKKTPHGYPKRVRIVADVYAVGIDGRWALLRRK